jgi:hypothetical protein
MRANVVARKDARSVLGAYAKFTNVQAKIEVINLV